MKLHRIFNMVLGSAILCTLLIFLCIIFAAPNQVTIILTMLSGGLTALCAIMELKGWDLNDEGTTKN